VNISSHFINRSLVLDKAQLIEVDSGKLKFVHLKYPNNICVERIFTVTQIIFQITEGEAVDLCYIKIRYVSVRESKECIQVWLVSIIEQNFPSVEIHTINRSRDLDIAIEGGLGSKYSFSLDDISLVLMPQIRNKNVFI